MNSQNMDKMGGEIVERQNLEENLRLLAAQRQLYDKAKIVFFWQIFLTTIMITILSVANLFSNIEWLLASYSVLITLIDLMILKELIQKSKVAAATIQEEFDVKVLDIDWNGLIPKVLPERVFRFSEKYKKKEPDYKNLQNWYSPKLKELDTAVSKIICQRSNCVYDFSLRESFTRLLMGFMILAIILVITFALIKGLTIDNFFQLLVLPILPMITFSVQKYQDNRASISALTDLKDSSEEVWKKVLTNKSVDIEKSSRLIQDRIFANRKKSPLIFNWFYNRARSKLESEMHFSVEQLVIAYKKSVSL
ncbi:MAG: hypothetical protein F6K19_28420 [Cyanothece sp. SIO1E1]|nr:hypothetical protein [Cyanothece sp. SIO1E1]